MKYFLLLLSFSLSLMAGDIDPQIFKKIKMLSPQHIKVTKAYDHGNIYEISLQVETPRGIQQTTAFVTKDKKVVLLGEALDAQTGEAIKRPLDMKSIRKNADVVYGEGSKEYIVFTDPECHFCVKFERTWPALKSKVKLYVYFMPLSNHHNATKMSYHVMKQTSQAAKIKALLEMAEGDKAYERLTMTQQIGELYAQKIRDNQLLANEFGVRGTPAVFDTKGNNVNWTSLGQ